MTAQYQTAGQDITTPKQIAQYGWLPNGVWGTNPVWINTAKRTTTTVNSQTTSTISPADYYYYQNDHLGTPQQLIDQAGNIVWQQQSTAFGETQVTLGDASNETNNTQTTSTTVVANPFRFAGQYFDIETNTNYNYHRQYAPSGGNYTQSDPIGLAGGINTYGYVGGNPLSYTDPRGESQLLLSLAIFGVAYVAILVAYPKPVANNTNDNDGDFPFSNPSPGSSSSTSSASSNTPKDDCGCYKILEERFSWWQGDSITNRYLKCIAECKKCK